MGKPGAAKPGEANKRIQECFYSNQFFLYY